MRLDADVDASWLLAFSSPVPLLLLSDGTRRWLASLLSEDDGNDGGGGATQSATQGKMLRGEALLLLLLPLPPDCVLLAGPGLRLPSRSPTNLRTNAY